MEGRQEGGGGRNRRERELDLYMYMMNKLIKISMKSTKVQTLGAVVLRAKTACTDDASIVGLGPLNWAIV